MNKLILCLILAVSSVSFASATDIETFFNSLKTPQVGTGTAKLRGNKYKIKVQQDFQADASQAQTWYLTTAIQGLPTTIKPSTTTLRLHGENLEIVSAQYSDWATILTSTPTELSFRTSHPDPVTGDVIVASRAMTLQPDGSLHVVSDIYRNKVFIQSYDYVIQEPTLVGPEITNSPLN